MLRFLLILSRGDTRTGWVSPGPLGPWRRRNVPVIRVVRMNNEFSNFVVWLEYCSFSKLDYQWMWQAHLKEVFPTYQNSMSILRFHYVVCLCVSSWVSFYLGVLTSCSWLIWLIVIITSLYLLTISLRDGVLPCWWFILLWPILIDRVGWA